MSVESFPLVIPPQVPWRKWGNHSSQGPLHLRPSLCSEKRGHEHFVFLKRSCPNKSRVQLTSRELWYLQFLTSREMWYPTVSHHQRDVIPTVSPNNAVLGFVLSSYQGLCFLLTDNHFCFSWGKGKLYGFPLFFFQGLSQRPAPLLGEQLLCFPTIPFERAKSFIVVRNNFISRERKEGGGRREEVSLHGNLTV